MSARHTITPILLGFSLLMGLAACTNAGTGTLQPSVSSTIAAPTPALALATPYAQQPAAGICASIDGEVVTITLNSDVPSPRCAKVRPDQTLTVVNGTLNTLRVTIGAFDHSILPGDAWSIQVPFGDYLESGVHQLTVSPCCGSELWLEAGK